MFIFRPVDLLATQIAPTAVSNIQGGRGFYVPAYLGLSPRRAGDMLTVRFGQLTVEGLSPSKIHSLAGCSHTPSRLAINPRQSLEHMRRNPYPVPPYGHFTSPHISVCYLAKQGIC